MTQFQTDNQALPVTIPNNNAVGTIDDVVRNIAPNKTPVQNKKQKYSILGLMPKFLESMEFSENKAPSSVQKYQDCLRNFVKRVGNIDVRSITQDTIIAFRKKIRDEQIGDKREASILITMRVFLKYCDEILRLPVMPYTNIKPPKLRRDVPEYLTSEEVKKFIEAIKITNCDNCTKLAGLRFRTLIEVLLSTGARISEALGITINNINFQEGEIKILGKGNKERIVHLNERAIKWTRHYLEMRNSDHECLFVTQDGKKKLKVHDIWRLFARYNKLSGLQKHITSHIFRKTFATTLSINGANLRYVKDLLGHADISTTDRYYVGSSQEQNKEAHKRYLHYDI